MAPAELRPRWRPPRCPCLLTPELALEHVLDGAGDQGRSTCVVPGSAEQPGPGVWSPVSPSSSGGRRSGSVPPAPTGLDWFFSPRGAWPFPAHAPVVVPRPSVGAPGWPPAPPYRYRQKWSLRLPTPSVPPRSASCGELMSPLIRCGGGHAGTLAGLTPDHDGNPHVDGKNAGEPAWKGPDAGGIPTSAARASPPPPHCHGLSSWPARRVAIAKAPSGPAFSSSCCAQLPDLRDGSVARHPAPLGGPRGAFFEPPVRPRPDAAPPGGVACTCPHPPGRTRCFAACLARPNSHPYSGPRPIALGFGCGAGASWSAPSRSSPASSASCSTLS